MCDVSITSPALFWVLYEWCIFFFYPFALNLFVYLRLNFVSWIQCTVVSSAFIYPSSPCPLIAVFSPFTLIIITNKGGFMYAKLLFMYFKSFLFVFSSVPIYFLLLFSKEDMFWCTILISLISLLFIFGLFLSGHPGNYLT